MVEAYLIENGEITEPLREGNLIGNGPQVLRDIDRLISEETGLHVQVADDPLTCVARGGGRALELVDMHGNEFFAPD